MSIRGLIFDFDGVIIDTETPEFVAWDEIYTRHGATLSMDAWVKCIGAGPEGFDPVQHLEELTHRSVDREKLNAEQRRRASELRKHQPVCDGIVSTLDRAKDLGLSLAIASSSPSHWVNGLLHEYRLETYFDTVCTRDNVEHAKPDPDLYLYALEKLGLDSSEAIAIEDSPNGIRAAKAAGLPCIAVLNPITRRLDVSQADRVLDTLGQTHLDELIQNI